VGSLAATASNSQDWRAVVLTGGSVGETGTAIMSFYRSVVIAANNPVIRLFLRLTPARRTVRRRHRFRRFIDEYFGDQDRLFFHAPAVVILTYPRRRRHFGLTDCVLAGQSMMLYAQSLGLGSCMIGYAEAALNLRKPLRRGLGNFVRSQGGPGVHVGPHGPQLQQAAPPQADAGGLRAG
jgi:nitroreductase